MLLGCARVGNTSVGTTTLGDKLGMEAMTYHSCLVISWVAVHMRDMRIRVALQQTYGHTQADSGTF